MAQTQNKKKILIVEDDLSIIRVFQRSLDTYDIVVATTSEQARRAFEANPDLALIVLDGKLKVRAGGVEHIETTLILVDVFRSSFKGPIVVTSGDMGLRGEQLVAGCTHSSDKCKLADLVKTLLG